MFPTPGSRVGRSAFSSPMDKCEIYLTASVTIGGGFVKVPLDTVLYDPSFLFDATAKVIRPRRPGWYNCNGRVRLTGNFAFAAFLGFNGAAVKGLGFDPGSTSNIAAVGSVKYFANGTTDTFELQAFISSLKLLTTGAFDTFLQVEGPY